MNEEDLVAAARVFLQEEGWIVLVARPSQAAVWFQMGRLRKAPDIVAVKRGILLVLEAKVSAGRLFTTRSTKLADDQVMQLLNASESCQQDLKKRLSRRLATFGSEPLQVHAGLLSAQDFTQEQQLRAKELVLIVMKQGGLEWVKGLLG